MGCKETRVVFSLDAGQVNDDTTFVLSQYIGTPPLDDTIIDVNQFIKGLSSIEKCTLIHLIEGYNISKLSNLPQLPVHEIQIVIEILQNKAEAYFSLKSV